jgi:hypothetical protein
MKKYQAEGTEKKGNTEGTTRREREQKNESESSGEENGWEAGGKKQTLRGAESEKVWKT